MFGCTIRYLPSAGRAVEKRQKMDASLRDGIFVGYRCRTGGKWAEKYQVSDCEAYSDIQTGTGYTAYVHSVSEICFPRNAAGGLQKHPTLPITEELLTESTAPADEPTAMSSTIPLTGSTIVATATVVTTCSASALH